MENFSSPLQQPVTLKLEGFLVPPGSAPLLFSLVTLNYLLVVLGNGMVVCVIAVDNQLHRPMFIMVCHLALCDLLGATAVLPRLMVHFLTGQQWVGYAAAIMQALAVHTYGAAVQTILAVMSYDRYVAVCNPLRYQAIMTSSRLHGLCALAWLVALFCIAPLFILHISVPLCGDVVRHVYFSNRSILQLACRPTPTNNIYGLSMTYMLSSSVFLIIAFSYVKILQTSVSRQRVEGRIPRKALQTCMMHLAAYVVYEIASVVIILSLRFPSVSQNARKFFSILFVVLPTTANPVIYGLVSRELRTSIIKRIRPHFSG
ncbi:olfactory receptor 2K2-like [Synchiropus splendidus]|uniref:olfactory receptor 2K2-like n=1 Tax=Synchiropus splendidus TaxID=270530 RepID=UPI00237E90BB|nr:olfactory receptor 2K2-like [Synchiropus splendidus]